MYEQIPSTDEEGFRSSASPRPKSSTWHRLASQPAHTTTTLLLSHAVALFCVYLPVLYFVVTGTTSLEASGRRISTWSPALESTTYQRAAHLDGEIVQRNVFRGAPFEPPTKEIDRAWHDIGSGVPGIRLTEMDLKLIDKRDEPGKTLHRLRDEDGRGYADTLGVPGKSTGGYLGMLEVFHLLHCLNSLRKAMFYNWEYYREDEAASLSEVIEHDNHCIDILRLHIMCTADVTPVTFIDVEAMPRRRYPMPDFSVLHTCRNFEDILQWSWSNPRAIMWEDVGNATTHDPQLAQGKQ